MKTQPPSVNELNSLKQKTLLRKEIRQLRQSLTTLQQKRAADRLVKNLKRFNLLLRGKHIALYIGNDGEICPRALISKLESWGKKAYLPSIHPLRPSEIVFCQASQSTRYVKNRFGIKEPEFRSSRRIKARHLSVVLMPLVAFDEEGNRMGMGGGFYDRAFHYKRKNPANLPRLVGLAHELQKQNNLPINNWDVPLNSIVTDQDVYPAQIKSVSSC